MFCFNIQVLICHSSMIRKTILSYTKQSFLKENFCLRARLPPTGVEVSRGLILQGIQIVLHFTLRSDSKSIIHIQSHDHLSKNIKPMSYNQPKHFSWKVSYLLPGKEYACRINYKCHKFEHLKLCPRQKLLYSWNYSICILILTPL